MSSQVCVDASFMVKLVLPEPHSERAEAAWAGWLADSLEICAPALLPFEVTSAIRRHVQRGTITPERGAAAVEAFGALAEEIILVSAHELYGIAWALAERYQRPNLYDAYYVALAESLDCLLWSDDEHLRRVMPGHAGRIIPLAG